MLVLDPMGKGLGLLVTAFGGVDAVAWRVFQLACGTGVGTSPVSSADPVSHPKKINLSTQSAYHRPLFSLGTSFHAL